MKIGIFGDSYTTGPGFKNLPEDHTFWCDVIGKVHEVENFGKAGTNLYWSYSLFKDNYLKYDTIIFVVTGFGRYYIPNADHHTVKHAFNIAQINHLLTLGGTGEGESYSDHDLTILKSLRDYKLYVEDDIQSALFHELLLSEIRRLAPNVILIPSWKGCIDPLKEVHNIEVRYDSLIDISSLDLDYCKVTWDKLAKDKRFAHMSPVNNMILGQDLLKYIESDRKKPYSIDLSLYKTPHPIPKETFIQKYLVLS